MFSNSFFKIYFPVRPVIDEHGKITMKLQGLEIMNDDPSAVRILYAKVESEPFQKIADGIYQYFIKSGKDSSNIFQFSPTFISIALIFFLFSGLAKREFNRDFVKLHMTLINTKYAAEDDDDDQITNKQKTTIKFDARPIFEQFGDFDFGTVEIGAICLAIMKTEDKSNGFYSCSTSIKF